jgi:hypothetical protein
MKYYNLVNSFYDLSAGTGTEILESCKNKEQLETIASKLNKNRGFKSKETGEGNTFYVEEVDTSKIKNSLTKSEIERLNY